MKIVEIAVVVLGLALPAAAGDNQPSPLNGPVKDAFAAAREATRQMAVPPGKAVGARDGDLEIPDKEVLRLYDEAKPAPADQYGGHWTRVLIMRPGSPAVYKPASSHTYAFLCHHPEEYHLFLPPTEPQGTPQDSPFGPGKTPETIEMGSGFSRGGWLRRGVFSDLPERLEVFNDLITRYEDDYSFAYFFDVSLKKGYAAFHVDFNDQYPGESVVISEQIDVTCRLIDNDHLLCKTEMKKSTFVPGGIIAPQKDYWVSYLGFVRMPEE